jgi:hypothetical protein
MRNEWILEFLRTLKSKSGFLKLTQLEQGELIGENRRYSFEKR